MPRDSYRRDRDYSYDREPERDRDRDRRRESRDRSRAARGSRHRDNSTRDSGRESGRDSDRERERRHRRREREYHSGYESNNRDYDTDRARRERHERRERYERRARRERPREHEHDHDRDRSQRKRRGHRATDSTGELLPRPERSYDSPYHEGNRSPTKSRHPRHHARGESAPDTGGSGGPLLMDSLAQLDRQNAKGGWRRYDDEYVREVREKEKELERARRKEEREEKRERDRRREERRAREVEMDKRKRYEQEMGFRRSKATVDPELEDELLNHEEDDDYSDEVDTHFGPVPFLDSPRKTRRSEYLHSPERPLKTGYTESPGRRKEYTESELDEMEERQMQRKGKAYASGAFVGGKPKNRVVSGPLLEKGAHEEYEYHMTRRGGGASVPSDYDDVGQGKRKKWKRWIIIAAVLIVILAIVIPVAVVMSKKSSDHDSPAATASSGPNNSNLDGMSEDDIPKDAQGTILDPFTWYDTLDFNVTYTGETVGGLSVMGLNNSYNDNVRANDKVPPLNETFKYGNMSIRGVNLGGWLSIEPFITPSFFESYSTKQNVIDEFTLTTALGASKAASKLEQHYSTFVTRKTLEDIRNAGFDHVRIPFSYWAVRTYDDDPYVPQISWRYLLRGIEWARQNGLRVNLDLHALPGSQNGWNHSGRQGVIGWLNGTDGDLNAQRSLDVHDQLSKFFAQPRYKNLVTMYGLANEPKMVDLDTQSVLDWYNQAIPLIRNNGIEGIIVFGDGFMGLDNWQGKLQNYTDLLLDVHQYVIFNVDQIVLSHSEKLNFACKGWTQQSTRSMNKETGFGPTMCGEWSQADADCAQYINNVGWGTRWEGTYNTGNDSTNVLQPTCPALNATCSCANANADPAEYSEPYKKWLLDFALAQMYSFEQGWGWFYWTWKTERATQWSYELGMKAGILPQKVWDRDFSCETDSIPDFGEMGLPDYY
ncbi:glycoside hydrolase family 5 protein [Aplosporella prunicola CBS 121167]|uniref:glucan 1,3-beta-glucosidase n=1 Tax=Aplosporella prunicola CBS 121167 TaxID=1176127 RepID=A0A6A6AXI4_9PEZI|nr:glycoside hydrolase family 5 protein [Aplosporella prunicola CBS 121167]KAF2136460.1 glycoside hydrolase family 5 protein [Aplosporella prunicola CBS 121167]